MILPARELLNHRTSNLKLEKLGKKERKVREELASRTKRLENELKAAKEVIGRLKEVVRQYE